MSCVILLQFAELCLMYCLLVRLWSASHPGSMLPSSSAYRTWLFHEQQSVCRAVAVALSVSGTHSQALDVASLAQHGWVVSNDSFSFRRLWGAVNRMLKVTPPCALLEGLAVASHIPLPQEGCRAARGQLLTARCCSTSVYTHTTLS